MIELINKEEILEVEDKIEKALKKEKKSVVENKEELSDTKDENSSSKINTPKSKLENSSVPPITSIEPTKKKSDTKML